MPVAGHLSFSDTTSMAPTPCADGMMILIIDDQESNVCAIHDILKEHGYREDVASSGEEALRKARETLPDLILLGLMPFDDMDICRHLKADSTTQDIPVLFVSAQASTAQKTAARTAGCADCLSPQLLADEFLARIRTQIRLHAAERQLTAVSAQLRRREEELGERERQFRTLAENVHAEIIRYDLGSHISYQNPRLEVMSGLTAKVRDISERTTAESRLYASEQMFRAVVENAPDAITRYDRMCRRIFVNRAAQALYDISSECLLGKTPAECSALEDGPGFTQAIQQVFESAQERQLEVIFRKASGKTGWGHVRMVPELRADGEVGSVLSILRDITELHNSEQSFRTLAESSPDCIIRSDLAGRILYLNTEQVRALGIAKAQDAIGRLPGEIWPDGRFSEIDWAIARATTTAREVIIEAAASGRSGEQRFSQIRVVPERDDAGKMIGTIAFGRDITELKRIQETLRAQELEFRSLAENLPDIVMRYAPDGRHTYVNPAYLRAIDAPREAVLQAVPEAGKWHSSNLSVDDYKACLQQVMRTGKQTEQLVEWKFKDATTYYAVQIVAERDANNRVTGVLCIGRDISHQMEAELRLEVSRQQLRDLAARREDAREDERRHIARELHDGLGQQLTALRFNVTMLDYEFGDFMPRIREATGKLLQQVNTTIQVAREVSSALRPAVLDMGIIPALEWLVAEYAQYVSVSLELFAQGYVQMSDAHTIIIFRIVQESLTNAVRHSKADYIRVVLAREEEAYVIEVLDNGVGFDPEAQRDHRSIGLLGIRERALAVGGELLVSSAPGKGTVLRVVLPGEAIKRESL